MTAASPSRRVFVVDDEPIIAQTLGLILQGAGFEAASYIDPTQLLAACASLEPDAVVSDVMMPQMTGIELAVRLGELYPACKVILISGNAATSDLLKKAWQQGHELEVLSKPVPPSALIEHVRTILS